MAFNFNWSPLIADTSRARDMLTSALNKSPKPPIIVGDIIVTELNLGSVPPELEILEIGDLAEDRFRGIFKMAYTGDAVLTLKTRVEANPLNTYLSTRPSFVSPQPLAASSGLTIPLQITLSDIRLSGFVILVFSKQKGITLVFRNDPLESLKVSSTFDSIPFVRDYLQKEIEGQLRVLFMEDLPAIIHRLSLQMWSPDHQEEQQQQQENASTASEQDGGAQKPINPFASPPVNPSDLSGRPLDEQELASLSPDSRAEMYASFSQKNLLHLAALTDSHRTLSLFTPPIRDAVFRAWAGASERGDLTGYAPAGFTLASLSRHNSITSSTAGSLYGYSDTSPTAGLSSRPSQSALSSAYATSSSAPTRSRTHNGRRRKHRVINLRHKQTQQEDGHSSGSRPTTPVSETSSSQNPPSQEREGELITPPESPTQLEKTPLARPQRPSITSPRPYAPPTARKLHTTLDTGAGENAARSNAGLSESPIHSPGSQSPLRPTQRRKSSSSDSKQISSTIHPPLPSNGSILEQAWMMKMASEIARRVQAERDQDAASAAAAAAAAGLTTSSASGPIINQDSQGRMPLTRKESGVWSNAASLDEPPPPAYAA